MKFLVLALFSLSLMFNSLAGEIDVLTATSDKKLDKEGRAFHLVLVTDFWSTIEDFCLDTYKPGTEKERTCFGLPHEDQVIDVVEAMGMKVLSIKITKFDPMSDGIFQIHYLHNYFGKIMRTAELYLTNDWGSWALHQKDDKRIISSVHFVANTRMGFAVGVKQINVTYKEETLLSRKQDQYEYQHDRCEW